MKKQPKRHQWLEEYLARNMMLPTSTVTAQGLTFDEWLAEQRVLSTPTLMMTGCWFGKSSEALEFADFLVRWIRQNVLPQTSTAPESLIDIRLLHCVFRGSLISQDNLKTVQISSEYSKLVQRLFNALRDNPDFDLFMLPSGSIIVWGGVQHDIYMLDTSKPRSANSQMRELNNSDVFHYLLNDCWTARAPGWEEMRGWLCDALAEYRVAAVKRAEDEFARCVAFDGVKRMIVADYVVTVFDLNAEFLPRFQLKHANMRIFPGAQFQPGQIRMSAMEDFAEFQIEVTAENPQHHNEMLRQGIEAIRAQYSERMVNSQAILYIDLVRQKTAGHTPTYDVLLKLIVRMPGAHTDFDFGVAQPINTLFFRLRHNQHKK
ncbi:MAG: hypothetical protein NT003_04455 [Candidatus Magasanikbacteria bacterium]|nr:hypothetical protein [Candidatus Magasanikbacteria bacterium]